MQFSTPVSIFREKHILAALEGFSAQKLPLDLFLNHYFRTHKALGSKDRREMSDTIYGMVRWLGLIDHFCLDPNWKNRLAAWREGALLESLSNSEIPIHIRASVPQTLFELLKTQYGDERAFSLCVRSNETAPTTIRVNQLKISRDALVAKWQGRYAIEPTPRSPWGLIFKERIHLLSLPEFNEGLFEIQDEGSQLVADLIDAKPGQQVLDYCAGSGGKALAFAHKLERKGQIYLHDIRETALAKAKIRLRRAGIENAQFHCPRSQKGKMDWVLVDAPCSGLGTLRRNPDLKWKWSCEMQGRLVLEQRAIFDQAFAYVKKGGHILYATCSILAEENEEQLDYFLKKYSLTLAAPPLKTEPTPGGMDGFYAALMHKSS